MRWTLAICDRRDLPSALTRFAPSHVVSLVDPGKPAPATPGLTKGAHLTLWFANEIVPGVPGAPTSAQVGMLLRFGKRLPSTARLLVQSESGLCRGPAAAFLLVVQALGVGASARAMEIVLAAQPLAVPNPLLVEVGARLLGRPGLLPMAQTVAEQAR
jgi:predicted protein tyrosine phosphatase